MDTKIENAVKNVGHLIDLWLPIKRKYDKIPGVSVGVAHKGKLLYSKGFGYTDLSSKKKVDEKTLYHIASISKTFTSVAIMQLVEKGQLRLDDKVSEYIDWFKGGQGNKQAVNITIRQILSHSSGLFRDGGTPHWETGKFPKDLQKTFNIGSLAIENGTEFKYTNYGFSLLGLVIEKVTGLTYDEYIQKNILNPLGMKNTKTDFNDSIKNVATGYGREIPDQKRKVFGHYKTHAYAPATGFLSNVFDLAKYSGLFCLDSDSKILNRESKKEMMRPHEKTDEDREYGLGLHVEWEGPKKIIGHGGGFNGFITRLLIEPVSGVAVIVLTNTLDSSGPGIAKGILKMIYSEAKKEKNKKKKLDYKKYEGLYRNVWGDDIIAQLGDQLISFSPRLNWPLSHAATLDPIKGKKDTFILKNTSLFDSHNEKVSFGEFKNGFAQKFIAGSGSSPMKRVKYKK